MPDNIDEGLETAAEEKSSETDENHKEEANISPAKEENTSEQPKSESDSSNSDKPEAAKSSLHNSLTSERLVLVVDEAGLRRDETVEIVKQVLTNAKIEVADSPKEAQEKLDSTPYDTCVVNFLMPGFSSSDFVKNVANHPQNPLLVGFSADKMSDAYDPKKGIKIKPLRRIFEIEALNDDEDMDGDYEEE